MKNDDLRRALRLACVLEILKELIREGWEVWSLYGERLESVSEHSHSCLLLANLLYPLYPEHEQINLAKVNLMLIYHDVGEVIIGDMSILDKRRRVNKPELEHAAWRKLFKGLSNEQEIYDLLLEFDEGKTPEARFARLIDKLDATKVMKHYYDAGRFHDLEWSLKHSQMIREDERIQSAIKDGAKDVVDVWFTEEFAAYKDDEFFMEAHRILREMNANIDSSSV